MEQASKLARKLAISPLGQFSIEDSSSDDEDRYLSYITSSEFDTLDSKPFKMTELSNLLASSDLR
jgi:hypothetical protein